MLKSTHDQARIQLKDDSYFIVKSNDAIMRDILTMLIQNKQENVTITSLNRSTSKQSNSR